MLLGVGMSPGAVLAFMLMGPATNVTTIGVLARLNGGRIAFWFAACMWGGTVALGFAANWCLSAATPTLLQGSAHDHGTFAWVLLFALAGVFLVALLRQGVRAFLDRLFESPANTPHEHDHAMAPGCCAEPVACATGPVHAHGHDHDHDHHRDHGHRH
jgi:ABC-type nickel/cobalt efflux system permease component RcnA